MSKKICAYCKWWKIYDRLGQFGICEYQATSTIPPREFAKLIKNTKGRVDYIAKITKDGLAVYCYGICKYHD